MQSSEVDRIAEYQRRGRSYSAFTEAELLDRWVSTWREYANDPWNERTRTVEADLSAEYSLRGQERPMVAVLESIQSFVGKVVEQTERVKRDPKTWAAANERISQDIELYKARRDRTKN